jgi:hypothetical protein
VQAGAKTAAVDRKTLLAMEAAKQAKKVGVCPGGAPRKDA